MYHVIRNYERVPAEIVEQYRGIGTATVHEAYGRAGAMCAAIKPIYRGMRVCGTALTVRSQPGDNLMLMKAIELISPGDVIVASLDGWEGGPWGELLSCVAKERGCAGLVIDGYVRDGEEINQMGFPVFSRGLSVKGTSKANLGLINHPLSCGGIVVNPGDLIVGNDDGVCVVARKDAADILQESRRRDEAEAKSREVYSTGAAHNLTKYWKIASDLGLKEEPAASGN